MIALILQSSSVSTGLTPRVGVEVVLIVAAIVDLGLEDPEDCVVVLVVATEVDAPGETWGSVGTFAPTVPQHLYLQKM